jgi:hypothetical protein
VTSPSAVTVAVILLCSIAACGPSLRAMEEHNRRALSDAEATGRAAGRSFEPPRVVVDPERVVAASGSHGLEPGETLYADASGQLVLVAATCAVPARCGDACARPVRYSFHRAPGGRVIVVRSRVVLDIVRTEDDSSCPAGCGGGAQRGAPAATREPPSGAGLGVTEIDRVELRTVAYTEQVVDRVCTNTTPVP